MNEASAQRPDRPLPDTDPIPTTPLARALRSKGGGTDAIAEESRLAAEVSRLPLLPRGKTLFENIPANAVVLEALGPAIEDGLMLLVEGARLGVVWVSQASIREIYAYSGEQQLLGDAAMQEVQSWRGAEVSAFQLESPVSNLIPAILRGRVRYTDLRLSWVGWASLIADLQNRPGIHVIEITTAEGRGIAGFVDGRRLLNYTDAHPVPGDPALVDKLAAAGAGIINIRGDAEMDIALTAQPSASIELHSEPQDFTAAPATAAETAPSAPPAEFTSWMTDPVADAAAPAEAPEAASPMPPQPAEAPAMAAPPAGPQAAADPFADFFSGVSSMDTQAPPGNGGGVPDVPVVQVLPDLKVIARNRLQRSADRVEGMLDMAAHTSRPLPDVLEEIRALRIRGVMQSTLDEMVAEMRAFAASRK